MAGIEIISPEIYLTMPLPSTILPAHTTVNAAGLYTSRNAVDIKIAREHPDLFNVPIAHLPLPNYDIKVGRSIHFDASKSRVPGPSTASYLWDFNGDGVFDQTTSTPVVDHAYNEPFDDKMTLRVQSSNGLYDDISALVRVNDTPYGGALPAAPAALKATFVSSSSVRIDWSAGDTISVSSWEVTLGGFPLGHTKPDQRSLIIADLKQGQTTIVRVAGRNSVNYSGPVAAVAFTLGPTSLSVEPISGSSRPLTSAQSSVQDSASGAHTGSTSTSSGTSQREPISRIQKATSVETRDSISIAIFAGIGSGIALLGFGTYRLFRLTRRQ